jgi:hypothetical protein
MKLTVDRGAMADDSGEVWLVYGLQRALWRTERFAKVYPNEKAYRHTLAEEAASFSSTAAAARELKEKGKTISPALEQLVALDREGMLEPFVLFAKSDRNITRDYVPYRAKHRDRLRRYLSECYITPQVKD